MGPLGESLAAWLLTPLLLYAAGVGLGLLAERVVRVRVPEALLAPLGFCAAIVLVMPVYRLGAGAWLATPLLALAALAGLALARTDLRRRLNPGWAGAAALAVYGLYLAPVVLAGGWTWTGYNFVNDTAVQFLLADHLAGNGIEMPPGPPELPPQSSALEHIRIYLVTGYPLGIHALLGSIDPLVPGPLPAIYQPVIAATAAIGAMALAVLAARAGLAARLAALAGLVAAGAALTYSYGLQGNAKEIAMFATLAIAAALAREALTARRPVAWIALVAVALAASISVFSAAAVPYAGAFALVLLVAAFLQRGSTLRRRLVPATLVGAAVLGLASLATLVDAITFGEVAEGTFNEGNPAGDLGQLLRPLPLVQTAGIWLNGDYRVPVPDGREALNAVLIVAVLALGALGLARLLRRRETGALLLLAPALIALAALAPKISPYATGKMLAILSPAVVLVAAVGIGALVARPRRLMVGAGYAAALALAAGVLVSDAFSYRSVHLAPIDRMQALRDLGERYAGRGFVLVDDFEEYAKYFMGALGGARENVAMERITPVPARTRLLQDFLPMHADIDQMPYEYLSRFDVIVQRRGPDRSRPPVGFDLDYRNGFYVAWVRRSEPAVRFHTALQSLYRSAEPVSCQQVRELAASAADGERLVGAPAPETVLLEPDVETLPEHWRPHPTIPGAVITTTPGRLARELTFEGGRYRIWISGSFGRELEVRVNGRRAGAASGVNTPGEWLEAGTVDIAPGSHEVALVRGGFGLGPGDRYVGWLGPVAFERIDGGPGALEWVRPAEAERLCGRSLDWVELARREAGVERASLPFSAG